MYLEEKLNKQALINELSMAGARVNQNSVLCPFHDDKKPSGSIYQRSDGSWAYHCHGCDPEFDGDVFDVREIRTGEKQFKKKAKADWVLDCRTPPPLLPEESGFTEESIIAQMEKKYERVTPYRYTDRFGKPLLLVLRLEKNGSKEFKQLHSVGSNDWTWGSPEKPWPLYNLVNVMIANDVIVTEGEKAAEALNELGFCATTSPAGAGKASYADWSPLAGKTVYLWPDKDEAGIKHMEEVKVRCKPPQTAVHQLYWINPPDELSSKGDAFDFVSREDLPETKTKKINALLDSAQIIDEIDGLKKRIEDTVSGKRKAINWPFPIMASIAKPLLPETVTIICGGPGSGKSFFLLQSLWFWIHSLDIEACVYELEEDVEYHLCRALAQLTKNPKFLDDGWVRKNGDLVKNIFNEHRHKLAKFQRSIFSAAEHSLRLKDIAHWVENQAKAGYRIICIDPVSVASKSACPWEDDTKFMRMISKSARDYQCSIVLVAHPKSGAHRITIDNLAGGASYQRLSQTILWIEKTSNQKVEVYSGSNQKKEVTINSQLTICKARNGPGQGYQLGMVFNNLNFCEKGVIIK